MNIYALHGTKALQSVNVHGVCHSSSGMKKTRLLTVVVGAAFFVALISLYRMLDLMQRLELEHERAKLPGHVEEVRCL